jgi:hypothetical protein
MATQCAVDSARGGTGALVLTVPIKTQAFLNNLPLFRELGADEIDRDPKFARHMIAGLSAGFITW